MDSIWFKPEFAQEIIKNDHLFEQTHSIVTDIVSGRLEITNLLENMAGVLTNTKKEDRERGMRFLTKLLKEIPQDYLSELQVKFICMFYIDRLNDNHIIIPTVLEGFLAIIDMKNYSMHTAGDFFKKLFWSVPCQSQVRQDRYNIYLIVKKLLDKDIEYMKSLGQDFVYGVLSQINGERDPRNLLFLFGFLPTFIANMPLGNLVGEIFEVISCYYPIDFHPTPDDPAAVTRDDLAAALCPCLCAVNEFGQLCLVLLIEKLDSSLKTAKIDSLKLLAESCKTFEPDTYAPFLRALWSSMHRELSNKTDDELRLLTHETLSTLVAKLSTAANTDQGFENFVKGVIISMQKALAESTTVAQFVQSAKVLLTTANASKESCVLVTSTMIPAVVAYYEFKTSPKLQTASIEFLGDLYEMAKHWEILEQIDKQLDEIPQLCLTAVSQVAKDFQVAGFKTLIRVINILKSDLVVPFVEVLIHIIQYSQDDDILSVSVETIHAIAKKYPELIMDLVVKGKCDLEHLTQDKTALKIRLSLLSNLASIDDFTKIIIEEMLKIVTSSNEEAPRVVEALTESMSISSLFTDKKLEQIESDHGLIDSIISWILKEIQNMSQEALSNGFVLISNTMSSLPTEKQHSILEKHTSDILEKCKTDLNCFSLIESLYKSVRQGINNSHCEEIMSLCLRLALNSDHELIRIKACGLIAHFLNKSEYGQKFDILYENLKKFLSTCNKDDNSICPRLIQLYAWVAKALIMRGAGTFLFWLQKILKSMSSPGWCKEGSEAIRLIMDESSDYLTTRHHCRISLLYKQRMFQTFMTLTENFDPSSPETKESYLLSWGYVLAKTPKSVLNNEVNKISPLVIDSLEYDNKDLLIVMLDILCYFVQGKQGAIATSLQTILPRLVKLSTYFKAMDVRIKSLQCLYDVANTYPTVLLLPVKQDLLLDLAPSLDDKKRLVRNVAVKARTRWFLVGAPGEPKDE